MLITAKQKFVRTSPRKLRLVADMVRKVNSPHTAVAYLEQTQKRAALVLSKVIKTAIANAVNNLKVPTETLVLSQIQVGEGPTYKRGQPVSRGRFHAIAKRTSHITVLLETAESKGKENKKKKTEEKQEKLNNNKNL